MDIRYKKTIKKIYTLLAKPFREHFLFMITFFVFATSIYFIRFIKSGDYYYSLHVLLHCVLVSYIVTLIIGLIRNNLLRKILQIILICISAILFGLNTYCLFVLGNLFDADYTMLALDTNVSEAKEFLSSLVPISFVLSLLVTYVVFIFIWTISIKHPLQLKHKWPLIGVCLIGFCAIKNIPGWAIWREGPIGKLSELYTSLREYDLPDESWQNIKFPTIILKENQQIPTNVVLIIGESFARYHSSLYGYDKETNPCLSKLKESSLLYTLDSIDSPASTTTLSLKLTLSTYNKNTESQGKKWYEYPTIIEIMKKCGFICYWFSNQAQYGSHNNIGRFYSSMCDQQRFLQHTDSLNDNKVLDKVLVDSTICLVERFDNESHNFLIYHMLGSHFEYEKRYPKEFSIYKESDYSSYPQNQRSNLSSYDNSIVYNDFIVEQIINLYKNTESIIVYLPDHGQDIYRSSLDYCAHGRINDPISYSYGVKIPLIIYASPLFQEKHTDVMQRIKNRQEFPKPWNSDNLPYLIMDLIGVKSINGESVQSKSVLN